MVAAEGRVFVGGDTFVMDEVSRNGDSSVVASKGDFSVVAYNPDGTIEWSRDYDQALGGMPSLPSRVTEVGSSWRG